MKWADLTDDAKSIELSAHGKYAQPDSHTADVFGGAWDRAAAAGAPYGLTPGQTLAAERLSMSPRAYAALLTVNDINEFREAEAAEQLREQARREVDLERIRDGLRGAA